MFYPKIRSDLYHNAYLLAGSEPPPPSRNEASLESLAEMQEGKKRKENSTKHWNEQKTIVR